MKEGVSDGTKYKYTAKNGTCLRSKYPSIYKLPAGCAGEFDGDEAGLAETMVTYGPLIVFISKS